MAAAIQMAESMLQTDNKVIEDFNPQKAVSSTGKGQSFHEQVIEKIKEEHPAAESPSAHSTIPSTPAIPAEGAGPTLNSLLNKQNTDTEFKVTGEQVDYKEEEIAPTPQAIIEPKVEATEPAPALPEAQLH